MTTGPLELPLVLWNDFWNDLWTFGMTSELSFFLKLQAVLQAKGGHMKVDLVFVDGDKKDEYIPYFICVLIPKTFDQ